MNTSDEASEFDKSAGIHIKDLLLKNIQNDFLKGGLTSSSSRIKSLLLMHGVNAQITFIYD